MRKLVETAPGEGSGVEQLQKLFGANLRRARLAAGLTQVELSGQTGLTQAYIGKIESGQINVTLATMKLLADKCGLSVASLLQG